MFFAKVAGLVGGGIVAIFILLFFAVIGLTLGALFWGFWIMIIMGALGHAWMGYHTAFMWGFVAAFFTGT